MKKIVLVARSFAPGGGGISRVARLMARSLSKMERDQSVSLTVGSVLGLDDVDETLSPNWRWRAFQGSIPHFVGALWRANFNSSMLLFDELSMVRAHVALPMRRKSMSFFHGIDVWEEAHENRIVASRKVSSLVTNSNYTKERAERCHGGFLRSNVCWLGTESDDVFGLGGNACEGRPTVLIVGRMQKGRDKGHRALLSAWVEIIKLLPDAILVVVGRGDDELDIRSYARELGLTDFNVSFLGFLSDQELENVWRSTWVFAMPSRGEGFGLVYIEAMQRGIPVIGSIHDAAVEVNLDGVTGFNVDLDSEVSLRDRLVLLLSNPEYCRVMGREALSRWKSNFSFSAFHSRFLGVVKEGLSK